MISGSQKRPDVCVKGLDCPHMDISLSEGGGGSVCGNLLIFPCSVGDFLLPKHFPPSALIKLE